jgi:hypothetical protein
MPVTELRGSGIPTLAPLTKAAFAMLLAATADPVRCPAVRSVASNGRRASPVAVPV